MDVDDYVWVRTTAEDCSSLEADAVLAGRDHDGSSIYVGRAQFEGALVPCKVLPRHRVAFLAHNAREHSVHTFDMYCRARPVVRWMPGSNGYFPPGSVPAGRSVEGEVLYVGRANHRGSTTPGRVQPSHGCCYISFGGKELKYNLYEVMVKVPSKSQKAMQAERPASTPNARPNADRDGASYGHEKPRIASAYHVD